MTGQTLFLSASGIGLTDPRNIWNANVIRTECRALAFFGYRLWKPDLFSFTSAIYWSSKNVYRSMTCEDHNEVLNELVWKVT